MAVFSVLEQHSHTYHILRDESQEPAPYSLIGALFTVGNGANKKHVLNGWAFEGAGQSLLTPPRNEKVVVGQKIPLRGYPVLE
jgi:hypothetical protein